MGFLPKSTSVSPTNGGSLFRHMMFLTVFPATVLLPVPLLLITCMFAIGRVLLIFDITPAWRMKVVGRPQPPGAGWGGPPVYTGGTRLWASVTFPPIVLNST